MEGIATGIAVEAVKAITSSVLAKAGEEIRLVWGFKDQLKKLQKKFNSIQAFLNDIEKGKHAEQTRLVNLWLEDVKEVAYSAENLLDDHAYEMLRRKIESNTNTNTNQRRPLFKKKFFSNCMSRPSTSSPLLFRVRMTHRVNRILSDLDELNKQAKEIGLQQVQLARDAAAAAASATSSAYQVDWLRQVRKHADVSGPNFIGRENDMHNLLHMVLNPGSNESGLSIIAIIGIGGLGKTTLAHQLYEHEEVKRQFVDKKFWICVSEDFDVDNILKEMVEKLSSTNCDLKNTDTIMKKLDEALMGNKFFLVLDDVWNASRELWDSFKAKLQRIGRLTRSVILITTRLLMVANNAGASKSYKLEGLSENDGWELLKKRVFDETTPCDPSLFDVGRKIVKKCNGVPLAIKAIGGLLQSKHNVSDWESIEGHEIWSFQPDENNYIMPSLLLSYNHINCVYAKQCFAYCAIFPKDSEMEKGQLIAMWLSQRLIYDEYESGNSSKIIGEKCFDILINYSFLQEETKSRYKMHDLVHDLATYVLKKDMCVWKVGVKIEDVDSHIRHLAINFKEDTKIGVEILAEEKIRRLRTIYFWHEIPRWNTLISARYVRTLVMAGVGVREVPYDIGQLVHLRYLDLSLNDITALPESICKLYQLQTLRLLSCPGIKELPKELHRLENLRHIETSRYVFAAKGLQKLKRLQTLPRLALRDGEGWTIDELEPLDGVKGVVHIKGLEHVKNKEAARQVRIKRKEMISELHLEWSVSNDSSEGGNDEEVLDSFEPHPNIQSLHIVGFDGVMFPYWMRTMSVKLNGQLSNLTQVCLESCKRCEQLPGLGQLPKLTILKLSRFDGVQCVGDEFYGNKDNINDREVVLFRALRELHLEDFEKLTSWMSPSSRLTVATTAFPCLETLTIRGCQVLERVPTLPLPSLKSLELRNVGGNQVLDMMKGSPDLNSLVIRGMKEVKRLPEEVLNCRKLLELEICWCEKLECIPSGMISLKSLTIVECPALENIEDGVLQGLSSLSELTIDGCSRLKRLPRTLQDCTSLEELWIEDCPSIEENEEDVVPDVAKLQGLRDLHLVNAGRLMASLPRWIPQLHRLQFLVIGRSGEEWDMSLISNLTSLSFLRLEGFRNLKPNVALPQQPMPSLRTLVIEEIEEMEALPDWIASISSLRELELLGCNKLKNLPPQPAMLRLSHLQRLLIFRCPLLVERCEKDNNGPHSEWPKISHIPIIDIDGKIVQVLASI